MTEAIASPQSVRREIWASFVSLLRSYAGAASIGGKQYLVHSFADLVTVKHLDHTLRVSFQPEDGEAVWHTGLRQSGRFQLNEDGTFTFPEGSKAMDIAAIDWIEQLSQQHLLESKP